jgi:2-alkyl-3-oxoalkanoate reductase
MKILVAGATGVLGRRLVKRLSEAGHSVVGLSRSPEGDAVVRSLGGTPARADLFDVADLAGAGDGAEVVIHAATALPSGMAARFRRGWAENDRIRTEGTRALVTAAGVIGARRYLQQGVAWVVRAPDASGHPYDEDTPPSPPGLVRSAVEGEAIARDLGRARGLQVGVLRAGSFYGPDTGLRGMMEGLRKGRLPVPGRGVSLVAPIHADDAAEAFVKAAESSVEGTWHVVDDHPLPMADFLRYLAQVAGGPTPRHIPLPVARLLLGSHVVEALTTSMNTTNARARGELGWAPRYPTLQDGVAATLEAWGGSPSPMPTGAPGATPAP